MRSHAKASTAGSTQRQAGRLGRFFRGALATRGASSDSSGSGAPSARRFAISLSAFAAILGALVFVVALAAAAAPQATTGSASSIEKTTATLNGEVNPEGTLLEECKFEYGTTASYGQTKPCNLTPAEIGTGTSNVAVSANLTGLTQATTYHFRVVAKSPDGTANGSDQTFKTLSPPVIAAEWAESVVRTEATLKAQINPEGFATTYKLEWGPTASYGNSTPESNVGSDKANHTVSNFLTGLTPDTTYHYRFVATNSIGTANGPDHTFTTYEPASPDTDCPNQAFRVGAAALLPNCRAYEMVSPVEKGGGDIAVLVGANGIPAIDKSSIDGNKATFSTARSFGDAASATYISQYIATRHAGEGWTTRSLNSPSKGGPLTVGAIDREYSAFSPDLSIGWLKPEDGNPRAPGAVAGNFHLYKLDIASDSYQALTAGEQPEGGKSQAEFQGSSLDGSHAVFRAEAKLTPEAVALGNSKSNVYEWVNGELRLVSIPAGGGPSTAGAQAGTHVDVTNAGWYGREHNMKNAISADGSRVYWSEALGSLYLRENADQPPSAINGGGECTEPAKACSYLVVSRPFSTPSPAFLGAAADGSKAIYTFYERGAGNPLSPLYEFDAETKTSTLIATGVRAGVLGTSDDLSYIYFASEDVLDAGAIAGEKNLYVRHGGTTEFIATVSADVVTSDGATVGVNSSYPLKRDTAITGDGRHIVFVSERSLTGYDNVDPALGAPVGEVFRYDADSGELTCVSCNPSGARPTGSRGYPNGDFFEFTKKVAAWITLPLSSLDQARLISDDGDRVFFNSFDALVPRDTNGAQDVYQWEAVGTGGCDEADPSFSGLNDGCVNLLSSGESPERSEFVDATPGGDNVFIRTSSNFAPQDPGLVDIYDARVGGGFAAPAERTPCVGDACQGAPEPPNDPTPASAAFRGAGDPTPRKAHRRSCRARHTQSKRQAKSKHTKRCKRNNRRAGR